MSNRGYRQTLVINQQTLISHPFLTMNLCALSGAWSYYTFLSHLVKTGGIYILKALKLCIRNAFLWTAFISQNSKVSDNCLACTFCLFFPQSIPLQSHCTVIFIPIGVETTKKQDRKYDALWLSVAISVHELRSDCRQWQHFRQIME